MIRTGSLFAPSQRSPRELIAFYLLFAMIAVVLSSLAASARGDDGNWWSLVPLAKVSVPEIEDPWIRTSVDAFILQRLQQERRPCRPHERRTGRRGR